MGRNDFLARGARHLRCGSWTVRRHFPPTSMQAITAAIAASEGKQDGEIRFAVEARLDWTQLWQGVTSRERALQLFSDLRIWDTAQNNGVLIYLLLAEHKIEIVADRGIDAHVGAEGWRRLCDALRQEFSQGHFEAGVVSLIQSVGETLKKHYPATAGDSNELPNTPVVV